MIARSVPLERLGNVEFPSEGVSPDKENDVAITEKSRNELRTYLEDTMGEERATTLMDHLPPVGWADVATRQDLTLVRGEIEQLRTETKQEFALLRVDIEQLRAETNKDIAHLREIMDARFESVATQRQVNELHRDLRTQTLALMATNLTLFGLVVAVLKFA